MTEAEYLEYSAETYTAGESTLGRKLEVNDVSSAKFVQETLRIFIGWLACWTLRKWIIQEAEFQAGLCRREAIWTDGKTKR